jgi:hypothetical protein
MLSLTRWRCVASGSRTQLGGTNRTVRYRHSHDRLQDQDVGRDDSEKPPQKLA